MACSDVIFRPSTQAAANASSPSRTRGNYLTLMQGTVAYIGVHSNFDLLQERLLSAPQVHGAFDPALRCGDGRQSLEVAGDIGLIPHLRRDLEPFFEQILRALVITLGLRQGRQGIERRGDGLPLAHLPGERQSSLRQPLCTFVIPWLRHATARKPSSMAAPHFSPSSR